MKRLRWQRSFLSFLIAALLLGVSFAVSEAQQSIAPDFTLPVVTASGLNGQRVSLSSLRGKVVLLEFMEPWCSQCQNMAPVLESLYQQYGAQNVVFLSVSGPWQGATSDDAAKFIHDYHSNLMYVYDSSGTTFSAYGVTATPTFFIIDKNGVVATAYNGEVSAQTLAADLTRLNATQVTTVSGTTTSSTTAQGSLQSGGVLFGYVYGFNMYDQLIPLEWVTVTATGGGYHFATSTGTGGNFTMFLPVGAYNVSISQPGYKPYSSTVVISNGSSLTVNFYLEESGVTSSSTTRSSQSVTMTVTVTTTVTSLTMSTTQSGLSAVTRTYLQISSNSSISNLQFDSQRKLITFTVGGPTGTIGSTSITFAKSLINGAPIVLIDNGNTSPTSFVLTSNSTHYFLSITYPHSTHSITVGGSNTISEFNDNVTIVLLVVLSTVLLVGFRSRRRHVYS